MLKGEKVILRAMRAEDLERFAEFRNDVELNLLGGWVPAPVPFGLIEQQYRDYLTAPSSDMVWFGIETQGRFIGQCLLHHFDHMARTCEIGITIGDRDFLNRGYGTDSVRLLVKYAFRLRNIRRVWLTVNGSNLRAQKAFAAAGFEEEGRLRDHIWLDGRYDDLVYMGILREDARRPEAPAVGEGRDQMPRMKPEVFEEFLQQPHVGVIATLRRDGMPYTVPVWWLWKKTGEAPSDDPRAYPPGEIWITGTFSRVWCKQLMSDGRSSLCIEAGPPVTGHVEFDGLCEALQRPEFDIWPISRELAEKYVGRRNPANADAVESFFANMQTEPRLLFRLAPQTVRAIDMRVYRGKRADREYQDAAKSAANDE